MKINVICSGTGNFWDDSGTIKKKIHFNNKSQAFVNQCQYFCFDLSLLQSLISISVSCL